jgi:thiosulfate reductase cytochrome b subunit
VATADSAYLPGLAAPISNIRDAPRHSAIVRITHWINTLSFFGLLVSGVAILLAHPRFYWGETGAVGTPSLFDLPLPFMKGGPSGWGRNLHFLTAWVSVLNGSLYVISGVVARHFRRNFLSARGEASYDPLQRLTYLGVVFFLFPLLIWTGFAMSPAIVSVFPFLVTVFGGQESARTLHFFAAVLLVLFFAVHIAMICLAGFVSRVRTMITGHHT